MRFATLTIAAPATGHRGRGECDLDQHMLADPTGRRSPERQEREGLRFPAVPQLVHQLRPGPHGPPEKARAAPH